MATSQSEPKPAAPAAWFPDWISRLIIGVTLSFVVAFRLMGRSARSAVPAQRSGGPQSADADFFVPGCFDDLGLVLLPQRISLLARRACFVGAVFRPGDGHCGVSVHRILRQHGAAVCPAVETPVADRQLGKLETTQARRST